MRPGRRQRPARVPSFTDASKVGVAEVVHAFPEDEQRRGVLAARGQVFEARRMAEYGRRQALEPGLHLVAPQRAAVRLKPQQPIWAAFEDLKKKYTQDASSTAEYDEGVRRAKEEAGV